MDISGADLNEVIQEQDRFLPIANVSRIMKRVVPDTGKLSKESKECVQECVTEFIQFIVSEASEKCSAEKRKTITCDDLLQALTTLGFESYVDVLKVYIDRYRLSMKNLSSESVQIIGSTNEVSTSNHGATTVAQIVSTPQPNPTLVPAQVYVDKSTGQHYVITPGSNTLVPVTLTSNEDETQ